jgi:hypothetical protein
MAFDIAQLAEQMFGAAFPILQQDAPQIGAFAEGEFKKIAQQLLTIETELASGQINADEANILIEMQKSASRTVLLTAKGLSLLTVEKALNAALAVAKTIVGGALAAIL